MQVDIEFLIASKLTIQFFNHAQELFIPAFAFLGTLLFQIISFCVLGTVIEVSVCSPSVQSSGLDSNSRCVFQNDLIYNSILACEWNLLPRREQISYLLLVLKAQNPGALSVGKLAPLNMITCVSVGVYIFRKIPGQPKFSSRFIRQSTRTSC